MTVIEAIKQVLETKDNGMTAPEIYKEIVRRDLYNFLAKQPISIVISALRRHCQGVDFPTANPVKHFKLMGKKKNKNCYQLIGDKSIDIAQLTSPITSESSTEALPEEKIAAAYKEHREQVKTQLLDYILSKNPVFFERLVLKLLLAMGYGYDMHSGKVTGGPHDKGIDGIIDEDRLGFSKIYIQAKRYARKNIVYTKEIKEFVGSMIVDKGVFITTSSFHKNVHTYAKEVEHKVKLRLIDGLQLVDLMLHYGVGVTIVDTANMYVVDLDFFSDQ